LDRVDLSAVLAYTPPVTGDHVLLTGMQRPSGVPAVAIWGDSHAAAAFLTDGMLTALGWDKAAVAPSFIPPTIARAGVRLPMRKFCQAPSWRLQTAVHIEKAGQRVGPALAALENTQADAWLWLDFRRPSDSSAALRSVDVLLQVVGTEDAQLRVQGDTGTAQVLNLSPGAQRIHLHAPEGFSQLRLQVRAGHVQIDGYAPEYTRPPRLIWDVLGIPGAVARSWQSAQPAAWWQQRRDYDLLLLEYGTNEGADAHFSESQYRNSLRRSLEQMRAAFPQTPCLLMGPTDRGVLPSKGQSQMDVDSALRYSRVHAQITSVQRDLALEFSCGFWDWQANMGGMAGAYHWYSASPKLMAQDLIHLSLKGYQRSGQSLVDDMRLRQWLAPR
jgi:lysophospholipase L1-like esterase